MAHVNKKLVHEYVNDWFNSKYNKNWVNTNDWEIDVFMAIAQWYYENEFGFDYTDTRIDKLYSLIKNDPLYVKNYKQWFEQKALNRIKKDF